MAKVVVEFDTNDKTMTVSVNQSILPGVNAVSFYRYGSNSEKAEMSMYFDPIEQDGMNTNVSVYAVDSGANLGNKPLAVTEDKAFAVFAVDPKAVTAGAYQLLNRPQK